MNTDKIIAESIAKDYAPKDAYGKRMARNIYAPTREECEEKLAILIKGMKTEIAEQKAKLKNAK